MSQLVDIEQSLTIKSRIGLHPATPAHMKQFVAHCFLLALVQTSGGAFELIRGIAAGQLIPEAARELAQAVVTAHKEAFDALTMKAEMADRAANSGAIMTGAEHIDWAINNCFKVPGMELFLPINLSPDEIDAFDREHLTNAAQT